MQPAALDNAIAESKALILRLSCASLRASDLQDDICKLRSNIADELQRSNVILSELRARLPAENDRAQSKFHPAG